MSPVVFLVLVELLTVVSCYDDNGVVSHAAFFDGFQSLSNEDVGLVAAVSVQVEYGRGVCVVVEFGLVDVFVAWRKPCELVLRQFKAVWQVVEQHREERLTAACLFVEVGNEVFCHTAVAFIHRRAFC